VNSPAASVPLLCCLVLLAKQTGCCHDSLSSLANVCSSIRKELWWAERERSYKAKFCCLSSVVTFHFIGERTRLLTMWDTVSCITLRTGKKATSRAVENKHRYK